MRVWWDDMATLTSLFSLLVFLSLATWGWKLGTGIDMWAVPVDNLDTIFKIYYTLINVYGLSRVCSRISVLLFYTRIFQNTPGRRIRIAVLVFDVICFAVIRSLAIFGCTPISHFWTGWDGEHVGRCINLEKTLIAAGVKDIVIDLVIIALPLPYIASLKLSKKKRIMSSILFSVGVIVIIICAVRLTTIRQFVESKNPTGTLRVNKPLFPEEKMTNTDPYSQPTKKSRHNGPGRRLVRRNLPRHHLRLPAQHPAPHQQAVLALSARRLEATQAQIHALVPGHARPPRSRQRSIVRDESCPDSPEQQ